jgi:heptose I phosphotransferase
VTPLKNYLKAKTETNMPEQKFIEISKSCYVDPDYKSAFGDLGLTSIDAIFSFNAGKDLSKSNLAKYRTRLQLEINSPPLTVFMKRYDRPPISVQFRNWLAAKGRISCAGLDVKAANELTAAGINTPKTLFYGEQWGAFFEKRSFIITEEIRNAESLERKLPNFFSGSVAVEQLKLRRDFIARLADFIKSFHDTNYRHRDLYFSHIFYGNDGVFYLIDLARAFRPILFGRRFRVKDIAQLYYSAPAKYFTRTDRLRFYLNYTGRQGRLTRKDKAFIRRVIKKARQMARHDVKHGREVPFES